VDAVGLERKTRPWTEQERAAIRQALADAIQDELTYDVALSAHLAIASASDSPGADVALAYSRMLSPSSLVAAVSCSLVASREALERVMAQEEKRLAIEARDRLWDPTT
jgi:small ligand-binding sensory domain FIST